MKFVAVLLSLLAVTATAKPFPEDPWHVTQHDVEQLGAPTFVLDVKWVRSYSPVAEMRDGTCYVYVGDRDENDLRKMGEELQQCARIPHALNDVPIAGARRIAFHLVDVTKTFGVNQLYDTVYTTKPMFMMRAGAPRLVAAPMAPWMGGFYVDLDSTATCTVVGFPPALGHEVKHCFDGRFHDAHENWVH